MTNLVKSLVKAAKKRPAKKPNVQPSSIEATAPYRFKPGVCPNPLGRGAADPLGYIRELSARMMHASPPKAICDQLGLDTEVTWGEAIFITLAKQGAFGDVASAREFLAALGFSGTAAKSLIAIQQNTDGGLNPTVVEFLRASHGLSDAQLAAVFESMKALPREALVVDASYLPPTEETQDVETSD